ncbi:hypothetical protein CFB47_07680 [Burkholderia sp. AU27893]|uniref:Uncharacterized protein n=1 Tax=Burkholderia contaminans TaxID=488447 RepID=A0A2S5DRK5_9BURK|nr:hypothetical protein CFB47_07680 [Burkholderia sp. AU27893]POZ81724.1 hypothetical protein C3743_15535 [Burkholderia contaminans]
MSFFDDNEDAIIHGRGRSVGPRSTSCNRCGKTGLRWEDDGDGNWVLLEGKCKVHKCDMGRAALDDFEVIQ